MTGYKNKKFATFNAGGTPCIGCAITPTLESQNDTYTASGEVGGVAAAHVGRGTMTASTTEI